MDPDLIDRAKQGDKEAFTTLVLTVGDRLYAVASAEDLANALATVEDREVTQPVDVELSGYSGKYMELRVPEDLNFDECEPGDGRSSPYRSFTTPSGPAWHTAPGETWRLWILDLDEVRFLIVAISHTHTPQDVVEEMEQIVESMDIASRG